jgi:hypothetical protein
MKLQERIEILQWLGEYMAGDAPAWLEVRERAGRVNGWFVPEFVGQAVDAIVRHLLQRPLLEAFARQYALPETTAQPKTVGVVMAGNIPLVGFHDFLCVFLSGHRQLIKLSEKDNQLLPHLVEVMERQWPVTNGLTGFAPMLRNCDAYIATGSNNSGRYFEYYFGKYPNLIRRNKTSVAVLTGKETGEQLALLAQDVHQYFGLGCRNVTQLLVPAGYDFIPLLEAFKSYGWMADHHKYKNNYDYNLALYILNKQFYMTNGSILLVADERLFAPVSQLNYRFYETEAELASFLENQKFDIQAIVDDISISFGSAQHPGLADYADGADTMAFLKTLN